MFSVQLDKYRDAYTRILYNITNMMPCFPFSYEKCAQEEDKMPEDLMPSALNYLSAKTQTLRRHEEMQEDLMPSALNYLSAKTQTPRRHAGELCEICMDTKTQNQMFRSDSCTHSYCSDCIGRHITAKIKENRVSGGGVKCPDVFCKGIIEPQHCGSINIRREVLDRWEIAVCESLILASQKFYCPYKDCSAMMVDDGSEPVTAPECPNCRRLFCAQCKVAWHAEKDCREFQSLDIEDERGREEDVMLMELAEKKQWRRCPRCSFYVERRDGCLHISCRCGKEFCYRCGATYSPLHVCPSTYDQD